MAPKDSDFATRGDVPNPDSLIAGRCDDERPVRAEKPRVDRTKSECPENVARIRPLAASQRPAVRSKDAVTIWVPSGFFKSAEDTASEWPVKLRHRTTVIYHSRAVLSSDAVTMRLPSGLKAADRTHSECPASMARTHPSAASQRRAVLSNEAVRTRSRPGSTPPKTPHPGASRERGEGASRGRVPQPCGLVIRSSDAVFPIWAEARRGYGICVACQRCDGVAGPRVPQPRGVVRGRGDDTRSVRPKTAKVTTSVWPASVAMALPDDASHSRAVRSAQVVTMRLPSGLKAAEVTLSVWPASVPIALPDDASHKRAVRSAEVVRRCVYHPG